ncbi:G5 domain-containing protein [Neobacillus sp. BF23-41]|uniref:G5 domain-containing protein n=1 Tax=Neobacillus sp. BF23-41 TaxID=3240280 RepID=UPI0034E5AD28
MTGEKFVYKYQITTKDEQKLAPKTIIQYSPLLLPGKTKVQTKGEQGQIVKVYREVYQGDQFLKSELISEDYYPPSYRIEIHGLAGSGQTTTQTTTDTSGNQVDYSSQTIDTTSPDGNQSTTTSDSPQQESTDNELWGKPNEQPK